jgi:hypothetical protein
MGRAGSRADGNEVRSARASLVVESPGVAREADHQGAAVAFRYHGPTHVQLPAIGVVEGGAPHLRMANSRETRRDEGS